MSNRVKTPTFRMPAGPVHFTGYQRAKSGDLKRGEGYHNTPHGPTAKHARRSILTLMGQRGRARKVYATTPRPVADLEAMTRDELRALAKDRGLSGYGKLNKAALVEVLS